MGDERLPEAIRDRFGAHVDEILRYSAVPRTDRPDVAEELLGHLETAYQAGIERGLTVDAAADAAIGAFGGASEIAPGFAEAFHSRLWASTIGVLLPTIVPSDRPPGVIRATVWFDRIVGALILLGAGVVLATESPVRALVEALIFGASGAVLVIAAEGLRRGQRWALHASLIALLANAILFFAQLSPPGGGWNFLINGAAAIVLLLWLVNASATVDRWLLHRTIRSRTAALVFAIVLVGEFHGLARLPIPDPTQIGPDDIVATASVSCHASRLEDGTLLVPSPTVVLDVTYRRVDLAPYGILVDGSTWGDVIEVREPFGPVNYGWEPPTAFIADPLSQPPTEIDIRSFVQTDRRVDDAVAFDESGEPMGPIAGEILGRDQQPGRTIRVTIATIVNVGDGREDPSQPLDGLEVDLRFHHLDRFELRARIPCGARQDLTIDG